MGKRERRWVLLGKVLVREKVGFIENTAMRHNLCVREKVGFIPERRWVLLKIPRCDIDGVGEGK